MNYIIDLDGTLLDGNQANLDAKDFIEHLQEVGHKFLIMTNSIKSPGLIQERLMNVGIEVCACQILNPIMAMNQAIFDHYERAYVVGSDLEKEQVGLEIVEDHPDVILLLDFEKKNMAYDVLQKVFAWMLEGIPVLTASRSPFYMKGRDKQLDTGAFVALLEAASNQDIPVYGKPSHHYFKSALDYFQCRPEDITVIGDDVHTDIKGAVQAGYHSVLLQSGKYQKGDESLYDTQTVTCLMSLF